MEKYDIIDVFTLKGEYFNKEENCVIIHLNNGHFMTVMDKPDFRNSCMLIESKTQFYGECVDETYIIPYDSVSHIIVTTIKGMKKRDELELYY